MGALVASLSVVSVAYASDDPSEFELHGNTYNTFIRDWETGRCLDADGSTSYTRECRDDNPYQHWDVVGGNGGWIIRSKGSDLCLMATNFGTAVITPVTCDPNNRFQNWEMWGNDPVLQFHNLETKAALDSNNDGAVYTEPPNGRRFQDWRLGY